MSQEKAKGLRKEYRKEVEGYLKDGGVYELYSLIIKPRPKWMWLIGAKLFINVQEEPKNA